MPKAAGTSLNSALSLHDVFHPVRNQPALARHFINALGRDVFESYYSFGFVRNPWDVAVSWFHYRLINPDQGGHKEAEAAGSFQNYAARVLTQPDADKKVGLQHPFLVDDAGALAVSFVGRYELLAPDFAAETERLAVSTIGLDHFNQSYHAPWPGLCSRTTSEIVGALVAQDAALFGYSTDPADYGIR